jgi:polyisoprenoid-binding protein YceI
MLPTNMRLTLIDGARVLIDLRASGVLRALAHSPTLTARPERVLVEVDADLHGGGAAASADATIEAAFRADRIEAPDDISASDREKMVENVRGREVLDAARFPTVDFTGRYTGTLDAGALAGELRVRGASHRVSVPTRTVRGGGQLAVSGAWEGRLTDLGLKPFKALLGAIKLEDWIRLRIEVRFEAPGA